MGNKRNKLASELTPEELEKRRNYHREYRLKNKDKINASQKKFREKNKSLINKTFTHRLSKHPLYKTWNNMTQRVKSNKWYKEVNVCGEWLKFINFYEWAISNGWQKELTIDRTNNFGDYEPSNCRWITQAEQMLNVRSNVILTYKGEDKPLSVWCKELDLNRGTVKGRLDSGWSTEDAFKKGNFNITPVEMMDKNLNVIKCFSTTKDAADFLNVTSGSITANIMGISKFCKGYKFRRTEIAA